LFWPCHSTVEQLHSLKKQYADLSSQFHGTAGSTPSTLTQPNDSSLDADFAHAQQIKTKGNKSVRFTDSPNGGATAGSGAAPGSRYAPYRDEPEDEGPDQTNLSNQQIHEYHSGVLQEQDEQLDRLGMSIGRQRELTIQIGDELDNQVMLLDEVDERVDRHQGQLDGATKRLNTFAKKAKENWGLTTIIILIIILVLLIVITKRW
jgi:syntaxin 8